MVGRRKKHQDQTIWHKTDQGSKVGRKLYQPEITLTINLPSATFPAASVAVYVTSVSPILKVSPGLLLDAIVGGCPESSVAATVPQVTATGTFAALLMYLLMIPLGMFVKVGCSVSEMYI